MRVCWIIPAMLIGALAITSTSATAESLMLAPSSPNGPPAPPELNEDGELVIPADQSLQEAISEDEQGPAPVHLDGAADEATPIPNPYDEPYYEPGQKSAVDGAYAEMGGDKNAPCGDYLDCCCCGPQWTFFGEAVWLQRDEADGAPLVTLGGGGVITGEDIDFDYETGWRVGAVRRGCCQDMEVSFLGIDTLDRTVVVGDAGSVFDGFGVVSADEPFTLQSSHELYSGEWNVVRPYCEGVSWLMGLRYLEVNERLLVSDNTFPRAIDINTDNRLYGAQVGVVRDLFCDCAGFCIEGSAKGGVYYNDADYRGVLNAGAPVVTMADASHTAFVGEVSLTARYRVNETLALRGGFQAIWIEGIALAPEQSGTTDLIAQTAALDTNGGIFYHGGFFGVEVNW